MNELELKEYVGKQIIAGVPHLTDSTRLFYHKGILLSVDNEMIHLRTRTGHVYISIDRIKEFVDVKNGEC